ncbi:MAG TPA: VWA domain-containing protein [Thermoanaerobaculia bacterium]
MRKVALMLTATVMAVVPVLADSAPPPAQSSFGDSIDVRVVNVEAVVTDRRGRLVKGLKASDFRLLVDGKEVPIGYFTEVEEGEMATSPAKEGEPAPAVSTAPGGKVGTSYLIFIDEAFTIFNQRNVVLQRLVESLRLDPADQGAVVAYDGRNIDLLSDWTRDAGALKQTLTQAQARSTQGLQRLVDRQNESNDAELRERADADGSRNDGIRNDGITTGGFGSGGVRTYTSVQDAVAAAGAALRSVSAPEGRKVLLLLSGGWPMLSPDLEIGDPIAELPDVFYTPRPEKLFETLTDTANLLGYTIYPVDVKGLDAESNWADARNTHPVKVEFINSQGRQEEQDSLYFMADETGGKAIVNSARLTAFDRVVKDTRTFYWLGFTPEWQANDQRHRIKVEVRRPGLKARARESFFDLSQDARSALRAESLLLFGGGEELADIRVRTGEPRPAGYHKMELPVTLEIPSSALTPLPSGEGYEVQARLSMGAMDERGGRTRIGIVPLRLTLESPPGPDSYARYETTLKLRKVAQRLVFTVEDTAGGGAAWAELDVEP